MSKILICFLMILVGACKQSTKTPDPVLAPIVKLKVPNLAKDSAYAYVAAQVAFGPRVPGTAAHKPSRSRASGRAVAPSCAILLLDRPNSGRGVGGRACQTDVALCQSRCASAHRQWPRHESGHGPRGARRQPPCVVAGREPLRGIRPTSSGCIPRMLRASRGR